MQSPSTPPPRQALGLFRVMGDLLRLDPNMPVAQALILTFVGARGRSQGPSVSDIAAHLEMSESRVSRNLTSLESAGLIAKGRDAVNFRVKIVTMTPAGASFLARLWGHAG